MEAALLSGRRGDPMPTKSSAVVDQLSELLSDSYVLYLKTQNFHWNVTGPMFTTLHQLFMAQYTELAAANDEIAERIRGLGAFAPGSFSEFSRRSKVKEATGHPAAKEMIKTLAADQDTIVALSHKLFASAEAAKDQATADLATRRQTVHEKNAWMLRSHLE
jgi:starvation-inducible DNA-binding protein